MISVLPLSAVVGADEAKLGLLLLAANPALAGLLIRGDKGTAKSTLARGVASLLPEAVVNEGCPLRCSADRPESWCERCRAERPRPVSRPAPFVTLPLGATEDQVVGSIDLEHALRSGEARLRPGLVAEATGGVLYVDEVNLLEDHLVDVLLDVAASKVNVVAREGVTASHPASFLLVGTMNPEEGELRPQLLDRFGLCADVGTVGDAGARGEIVSRVLAFEADAEGFAADWQADEDELRQKIARARALLRQGAPPSRVLCETAGRLSLALDVAGQRADVLLAKASITVAALEGRGEPTEGDVAAAARLVYPHRLRRRPFDDEPDLDPAALGEEVHRALTAAGEEAGKKAPRPG